jgi:hypothetical protein
VAEIRNGPEEPDRENRPETTPSDDTGAARERVEPRSRAEYTADLERHVALVSFEPRRAGLPEVSVEDATAYLDKHHMERPWLSVARDCPPEVQRVFAALDQGGGHAHIRHEGWVTEEMNECRVRNLEDPAQLDPAKRVAGVDGVKVGDKPHRCGSIATRITDPQAFATAFARGIEHPDVRAALDSPGPVPRPVSLPISDVLSDDGHKFCSGWRLEPVNGSILEAMANRAAWVAGNHDVLEPRTRPVETFEGGTVTYVFRASAEGDHEISTMYVDPPDEETT